MSYCQKTSHYPSQTRIDTAPCLHEASMRHKRHFAKWKCTQPWVRHSLTLCKATSHNLNHCCLIPVAKGHHLQNVIKVIIYASLQNADATVKSKPAVVFRQCHSATYRKWVLYILLKNGRLNKEVILPRHFVRSPAATPSNGYSVTGATAGTTADVFPLKRMS